MATAMKPHDLVRATKQFKGNLYGLSLDMESWRAFKNAHPLTWSKTPFHQANKAHVPKERGIYVFSLEVTDCNLPDHSYILYVGIAGLKPDANLHKRFGQYLLEPKKKKGRPKVIFMLENWKDSLVFNFAHVQDKRVSLKKLEQAFLDAVLPPINVTDFSGEIVRIRKAAF